MPTPLASQVAEWVEEVQYEDLPADVIESTKLRILDVIGLALAPMYDQVPDLYAAYNRAASPAPLPDFLGRFLAFCLSPVPAAGAGVI